MSFQPNTYNKTSAILNSTTNTYGNLCTEYYELDKPHAPQDALNFYLDYAREAKGSILEPMCGSGRFLVPLLKHGFDITGFDSSSHMLNICRNKCDQLEGRATLLEASFENFASNILYKLIIIPSGSFCLLTESKEINHALETIVKYLDKGGKFIFEIDTLSASSKEQGIWNKHIINKNDGTQLILNSQSSFSPQTSVETGLCRYERWDKNEIIEMEEENFCLKLYSMAEIETLLEQNQLVVINKWSPYKKEKPSDNSDSILYECMKKEDLKA